MARTKNPNDTASGTFEQDTERPDLAAGSYEIHPMYVVTAGGVGSFVKGEVVQAGDLGSAEDIRRLHEEIGAIAPWQSAEGAAAVAEAKADSPDAPAPLVQVGVPYIDPATNTGESHADPPSLTTAPEADAQQQAAPTPDARNSDGSLVG